MIVYSKKPLQTFQSCTILGIETVFLTFYHGDVLIQALFLYCSPQLATLSNFNLFMESITQKYDICKPMIIMGDTNLDFMTHSTTIRSFTQRYGMMHSITTDYGSCLDHVYTRGFSPNQVSCATLESYYSDHKPIVAYLPY